MRPRPASDLKTELNFSVNDSNITRYSILDTRCRRPFDKLKAGLPATAKRPPNFWGVDRNVEL